MKEKYPRYEQGSTLEIEKKLSKRSQEMLNEFLKERSITAGESKVEKIKRNLLQFFDITELQLDEQTKESVNGFLIVLNKSDRSVWTKNELKVYLKQFLKKYYKDYEMVENIKSESRGLNPKKINENNLITEGDIERMLRYAQNYKERVYLILSFLTGARPQELSLLKWNGVKFEDKFADITLFSNKTNQSRTFPIDKRARDLLFEWKQHYCFPNVTNNDYVFPNPRDRENPMTSVGLNKMLRRLAKASGLKKDVWNYLMRHTRATRLYEELPTPIVEKLMGHKNMSGIYAHISSKKAREEMLNKIYKVEEITKEDKEEIKKLKEGFEKLIDLIIPKKLSQEEIEKLKQVRELIS